MPTTIASNHMPAVTHSHSDDGDDDLKHAAHKIHTVMPTFMDTYQVALACAFAHGLHRHQNTPQAHTATPR